MLRKKKFGPNSAFNAEKVFLAASQPVGSVFNYFQTNPRGLSTEEVEIRRFEYGANEVEQNPQSSRQQTSNDKTQPV